MKSTIEEKLLDEFHSWFSGYDYIQNKMEATLLVVKAGKIPESLEKFIYEIRECLAFDRLLGAAALLRVTIEITVKDLIIKNFV